MDRVSLNDVIDASRPRTYLVRQGQIVVRPREGEIDEGLRECVLGRASSAFQFRGLDPLAPKYRLTLTL